MLVEFQDMVYDTTKPVYVGGYMQGSYWFALHTANSIPGFKEPTDYKLVCKKFYIVNICFDEDGETERIELANDKMFCRFHIPGIYAAPRISQVRKMIDNNPVQDLY